MFKLYLNKIYKVCDYYAYIGVIYMANMDKTLMLGISVLVIIVVMMSLGSTLIPEVQSAGDELNDSNRCTEAGCYYNSSNTDAECTQNATGGGTTACGESAQTMPLGGLFSSDGIVPLIIIVGLLVAVIGGAIAWAKVKK
jgi:ABC-type dipeptide/oligopeptide/nickel transport system permease subunit